MHAQQLKFPSFMTRLRWLRRSVTTPFQDDIDGLNQTLGVEETNLPKLLKLSMLMFSIATFLFIVWSAFTVVKELARTEGQVIPAGYSQIVQHLEGGLVHSIVVHEGDFVEKGQLLAQINGAGTVEDLREQQALVQSLKFQAEKLGALLENRKPDFSKITTDEKEIAQQTKMFAAMREARTSEKTILEQQIIQRRQNIARLRQSLSAANANLAVASESKKIFEELASKGMAARTAVLSRQQEFNSRTGEAGSYSKQIGEASAELAEYQKRLSSLTLQQQDSAYTDLNRVESDLAQATENLKKRQDRVGRLDVRAPVTGYIKGLKLNTIGSVIPAGQTIMEIVPVEEQLVVEVKIPTQQIGRVAVGQKSQVKVDSYDYVRYGTIEGQLESISAMTFTDEAQSEYYKGRVKLMHNYIGAEPGKNRIIPGMTVDADIVIGEKTVLAYLLKPIRTAIYNSFSEQ